MSGFPPRGSSAKCTRSEAAGVHIAAVRAGSDGFGLFGLFNLYKMTRGGFAAAQRVSISCFCCAAAALGSEMLNLGCHLLPWVTYKWV